MLDFALVCRVFLVACSSISKAALIIASGALLAQRGVLTSDVRQGMSHMAAGLLVPCLPMVTRTPRGLRAVRAGYPWIDLPRAVPTGGAGQLAWVGPTAPAAATRPDHRPVRTVWAPQVPALRPCEQPRDMGRPRPGVAHPAARRRPRHDRLCLWLRGESRHMLTLTLTLSRATC